MNKKHLLNWRAVLAAVVVCCLLFVGIYQLRKKDGVRASYNDSEGYTYASEDPLFAATHFHMFAQDRISMEVHTHGNVACKSLNANVDFGTRKTYYGGKKSEEISYARNIERINPNAVAGTFILGSDYEVTSPKNANQTVISDGSVSHTLNEVSYDDIVLENDDAYVLDLDAEFEKLRKRSKEWAKMKSSDDVVVDITSDQNNRYIDLADVDMERGITCVEIPYDEWTRVSNPITLKNLDADNSHTGIVVINIDLKGKNNPNLSLNEMKASVREGDNVNINNNEVAPNAFGSVRVVYNIYDSSEKDYIYDGYVTFGGVVYGSVLAPGADLTVGAINGSAIAKNIMHSGGESHRNDIVKERAGEEHISDEVKEELSPDAADKSDEGELTPDTEATPSADDDTDSTDDTDDSKNTDKNNTNSNNDDDTGLLNPSGSKEPETSEPSDSKETAAPDEEDKASSTPAPTESATDKPSVKDTPKPTEKATPKADKKDTPKPTEKATPKPEKKDTPKPTEKATTKPEKKDTPKPTEKATPKPEKKDTPKPTEKATPKPEKKDTPKPTEKATKKPEKKDTPKPAEKATPKADKKDTPKPTEKATEKPVIKTTPKAEATPKSDNKSDTTPPPSSNDSGKGTAAPNETPSAGSPDETAETPNASENNSEPDDKKDESSVVSDESDSSDDGQNDASSDDKESGNDTPGELDASKSDKGTVASDENENNVKEDLTLSGKTAQNNKSLKDTKTTEERVKSKYNAPKTGDDMNFAVPICIMAVSFIMFVVLLVRKRSIR